MAYAGVRIHRSWPDVAYLCRAGVRPEFRGHGLQRRLIAVRVAWAKRRGLYSVTTEVADWNVASANSLIRAGFKLWRPHHLWSGEGYNYFHKRL
jgi:GNAT superfamily N-acetyltransferase